MDNPAMTLIETIALNLTAWMSATPGLRTIKAVSSKSGVGFGTVRRMKGGTGNPTVQNLQEVAKVFDRSVIDLMREPQTGGEFRDRTTVYQVTPVPLEAPLDELVEHARAMTRDGQMVLLGHAQALRRQYAKAKANRAN